MVKIKIQYYIREVYGSTLKYVKSTEQAEAISRLTGTKTITDSQVRALEALGFNFEQVIREV